MRRITGSVFQSLDGVMQAPGGPDEDRSGGFDRGGWVAAAFDPAVGETIGRLFAPPYALLLGRTTYDIFAGHWPQATGEAAAMGEALTRADKYVLTRRGDALGWANSHRLADIAAVAALKETEGPRLLIQGSSTLYPALLAAGLIDQLTVLTFPIVLGGGKRPFGAGTPAAALRLVAHTITPGGVVIATYEPAGPLSVARFGLDGARETPDDA
jgi:dihydrofolate reductase